MTGARRPMGPSIDLNDVTAVLLTDGVWHAVEGATAVVGSYEFRHNGRAVLGGGGTTGVSQMGLAWKLPRKRKTQGSAEEWLAVPLSSILAVRYGTDKTREVP